MGALLACGHHLKAVAAFYCPKCDMHLCKECSKHVWAGTGFLDQCITCQAMLEPLEQQVAAPTGSRTAASAGAPEPGTQAFLARVPDMLAYPFKGSVMITIAGLALLTAPIAWAVGNNMSTILAWLGFLIILGLDLMVYFTVIIRSAHGEDDIETPDFDNMFDDFFAPIGRYLLALLPIFVGMAIFGEQTSGSWVFGIYALSLEPTLALEVPTAAMFFFAGVILLPLLTAIAAIGQSARAVLNPVLWIRSLRVMWATYPVAVVAYYLVLAFEFLWFRQFLLLEVEPAFPVPILRGWLIMAISYIPFVLRARILGQMCAPYLRDFN